MYVIDDSARLIGLVPLTELMAAAAARPLAEIMNAAPPRSAERGPGACRLAGDRCGRVGRAGGGRGRTRLLGCVPAQALIAILRRGTSRTCSAWSVSARQQPGVARDPACAADARARERLPWLLVGLAGSIVATFIMSRFQTDTGRATHDRVLRAGIVYLADAIVPRAR